MSMNYHPPSWMSIGSRQRRLQYSFMLSAMLNYGENGLITRRGRFVAPANCFPEYLRAVLWPIEHKLDPSHRGSLGRADVRTISLTDPVLVGLHPNLTYGYFVTEMLPRLFLATVLRQMGAVFRLALPRRLPP